MKKKLKLFVTIASFCFVVFMFCFGVYAAINVNYNISGTVSYNVEKAYVEITTKIFKDANKYNQSSLKTQVDNLQNKNFTEIQNLHGQPVLQFEPYNSLLETGTSSASNININYNDAFTYYIVINIKNLSSSVDIDITLQNTSANMQDVNSITYLTANLTNIKKTNNGENVIIAYCLDDATKSVNVDFNYDLTVSLSTSGNLVSITGAEVYAVDGGQELLQVQDGEKIKVKSKLYLILVGMEPTVSSNNINWDMTVGEIEIIDYSQPDGMPGRGSYSIKVLKDGDLLASGVQNNTDLSSVFSCIMIDISTDCTINVDVTFDSGFVEVPLNSRTWI